MYPRLASLVLLAAGCASAPVHAALWSATNNVVGRGQTTTMTISLTGDGLTDGAEVAVGLAPGVSVLSVTGRNGGLCVRLPKLRGARVLWVQPAGLPLPAVDTPMCELRLNVTSSANSAFLPMREAVCAAAGDAVPCALDPGYLTVTP